VVLHVLVVKQPVEVKVENAFPLAFGQPDARRTGHFGFLKGRFTTVEQQGAEFRDGREIARGGAASKKSRAGGYPGLHPLSNTSFSPATQGWQPVST
jgi:hypothetical protein